jgi:hypothetical protein
VFADSVFADSTFADSAFADSAFADSAFANCIGVWGSSNNSEMGLAQFFVSENGNSAT